MVRELCDFPEQRMNIAPLYRVGEEEGVAVVEEIVQRVAGFVFAVRVTAGPVMTDADEQLKGSVRQNAKGVLVIGDG